MNKKRPDGSNWTPLFTTRVCSVHFVTGKHNPTRGHVDYVPSIFPDSPNSVPLICPVSNHQPKHCHFTYATRIWNGLSDLNSLQTDIFFAKISTLIITAIFKSPIPDLNSSHSLDRYPLNMRSIPTLRAPSPRIRQSWWEMKVITAALKCKFSRMMASPIILFSCLWNSLMSND